MESRERDKLFSPRRSACSCEEFEDNVFALVRRLARHRNIPNAITTAASRDRAVARAMRIGREVFNDPDGDDVEVSSCEDNVDVECSSCDDGDNGDGNDDVFGGIGEAEPDTVAIGEAMGSQCISMLHSATQRCLEFNSPVTGMLKTITVVKVTSEAS